MPRRLPISLAGISRFFLVPISLRMDFEVARASISSVVFILYFICLYIVSVKGTRFVMEYFVE